MTAQVWAEHSVWPQDPGLEAALQGGVTSMQMLPGSANLIGGRGVTVKNVPATTYQAMTPATRVHLLSPDQGLSDALQLLAQHDVNQLPVIEKDALVGILARADVVRYLQWRKERNDLAGEDTAIPRAS